MDTCNEEAPIRAGRSPALAAALILFVQNRKGARTAAKTEAFDAERPQENQGRKPGLLQTLEGKFRRDPFSDRRAAGEAGKGRSQRYIKPELSPGRPDKPDDTDECAADGQQAGSNHEQE